MDDFDEEAGRGRPRGGGFDAAAGLGEEDLRRCEEAQEDADADRCVWWTPALGRRESDEGEFSLPEEEEDGREDAILDEERGFETERLPMKVDISLGSLDVDATKMRDPEEERVMGEGELGVPGTLARVEAAKEEGGRGVRAEGIVVGLS